jgi:ornithine cyclodeaminase
MPAWTPGSYLGVKAATIFPSNVRLGIPSVSASYLLMDGTTGEGLAMLDGPTITAMRTGAASALASSFLSRPDAQVFLMIGAGALAEPLIRAHATVRSFSRILLWNRSDVRARRLHAALGDLPGSVERVHDLREAVRAADVITCATLSREPLVQGSDVKPGAHVDLVGAYRPDMRESDNRLIARARVFVDSREGAAHEAGDLLHAVRGGGWSLDRIVADLSELCRNEHAGRAGTEEITLFKSVGMALEDLAAASLAYERISE